MNTPSTPFAALRLPALLAALILSLPVYLRSQTTASETVPAAKTTETVVLSPFTVTSTKDTGYQATDSLAGTRLRTPLRDIAASISVVTKDFLDDTGATNLGRLLVYTTGTEVNGIGGNYSASGTNPGSNQDFDPQRRLANSSTRLRGLASADTTRNYFGTAIPLDAYNTESVTINRGSNSILFGLGSPAGIIENTTLTPQFKTGGKFQFRFDSNDGHRESLDFEQVIMPGKLSLRAAALNDESAFEQKPAYRDQQRLYGALTFRPFQNTTIRLNGEGGRVRQSLPRIDPPIDSLTYWWSFGKPERADNIYAGPPFTAPGNARVAADTAANLNGPFGTLFYHPGVFFADDSGNPTDAFPSFADTPTAQYRYLAPTNSLTVETLRGSTLSSFKVPNQILDRSIFDYRKHKIDGLNDGTFVDFNAINLAAEQLFLGGDAGLEAVYDRQRTKTDVLEIIQSPRGNEIRIDVNRQTVDGRPNPNFGRPFISSIGQAARVWTRDETYRFTGFYKFDFSKHFDGWVGRLLGHHTLTGFYTKAKSENTNYTAANALIAPTFVSGENLNGIGDRRIATVYYLGPSLAGASSAAGANLHGVQSKLTIPDALKVYILNNATGNTWVQQTHQIYQYPDFYGITTSVTAARNEITSYGGVLQGNWLDDVLVSTLGWRHDEVANFNGNNNAASGLNAATGTRILTAPVLAQSLDIKNALFSQGYVLHTPAKWRARLPGNSDLSLYYNDSENFQVTGFRQDFLGHAIDPQSGSTKEWGVGLTTFNGKFSLRAARYETSQINLSDTRVTAIPGQIASLEQRILNDNPAAVLAAAGYVPYDDSRAGVIYKQFASVYNFTSSATTSTGTRVLTFTAPVGSSLVTDSLSKGLEFEAVYNPTANWRMMFNVSKERATRGSTATILDELIAERSPYWALAGVKNLTAGSGNTVASFSAGSIINPYNIGRLSTGLPAAELRKWRANVITNYTFGRATILKGWSIGGAARWQDKIVLGFPVFRDPVLGLQQDVTKPFMGDDQLQFDSWLTYQRPIYRNKINWKVQLNVRNLFDTDLLIPVRANPVAEGDYVNYTIGAYRIGEARTWELSSTFSF
jgi:outer membrane receptor for ferric coprogen and ferric-rhodotorulic acid